MRNTSITLAATVLLASTLTSHAEGQDTRFNELKSATDDIAALLSAEGSKSALCKSYIGTVVTPTPFAALVRAVPKITAKGEFETTAQYEARIAAAKAQVPGGPYVLTFPVRRDYLRYDADIKVMFVEAGAFRVGQYSDEPGADVAGWGVKDEAPSGGTPMFHSVGAPKLIRSYSARSRSGVPFRVTEFERQTNSLYVTSSQLFAFARDRGSPIMGFDVPLARAPVLKQALRLALVVAPQSPYLFRGSIGPIVPSLGTPNVYKEFTTVAIVAAKCGLALDGQNRVLASMDAGS